MPENDPAPPGGPDSSTGRAAPVRLATFDRVMLPIIIALVTAVASVAAGYIGANTANDGARTNLQAQIDEQRAKEDRDRRISAYVGFLDAANTYANATQDVVACAPRIRAERPPPGRPGTVCVPALDRLAKARSDFQRTRNRVFYFGSNAAEAAAFALAQPLPPAVGGDPTTGRPPIPDTFDYAQFSQLYSAFNRVVCEDLNTDPTRTC